SVDNIPPSPVQSLSAEAVGTPSVNLHWTRDKLDPDVGYYEVHRSTTDSFMPNASTRIGQTSDTSLVDAVAVSGMNNYYRIVTVDVHGNTSQPSVQAVASPVSALMLSVKESWNLVSVPLNVDNYTKTSLFPTSTSSAFAFQGAYVATPVLANGIGYWLKF